MTQQTIDTHAHYWPTHYLDQLAALGSPDTAIARGLGAGDDAADMAARLQMMDEAGVQTQVLSATPQTPQWGTAQAALALARELNTDYAALIDAHPDRFMAYGTVPLPHVTAAIEEGRRVVQDRHFVGIALNTLVQNRWPITDERFLPFFEAMNELGTIIYLHPTGCGAMTPLVNDYQLEWVVGAPIEDLLVTLQLLKTEYATRFPNLRFHIAHLGGGISFQMQRILDNYEDWGSFKTNPLTTLRQAFWFDAANFSKDALHNSVAVLGSDRILMGSDFPYFRNAKYTRAATYIDQADLTATQKRQILHDNARQLYHLH